jgi:hypothetical protein
LKLHGNTTKVRFAFTVGLTSLTGIKAGAWSVGAGVGGWIARVTAAGRLILDGAFHTHVGRGATQGGVAEVCTILVAAARSAFVRRGVAARGGWVCAISVLVTLHTAAVVEAGWSGRILAGLVLITFHTIKALVVDAVAVAVVR